MTTVATSHYPRKALGRTGYQVSPLAIGTAAWGTTSPAYGVTVPEEDAIATVHTAVDSPINVIDTSNNYGDGESERRIGVALAQVEAPHDLFVQTKLDRDPETNSFSADRMRRSLEESLERLGLDRLPMLFLHDPEHIGFEAAMVKGGPVDELIRMREEGLTEHIGISGGPASMLMRFVDTGIFDALITHHRYTLVDRTSDELLTAAEASGMGVFNGAAYGGGILAEWPRTTTRYHYAPADPRLLEAIDAMGQACERYGVPLRAAALQFSARDPRIHSTIVGIVSPAQLHDALALLDLEIPEELWAELESLLPDRAVWIND